MTDAATRLDPDRLKDFSRHLFGLLGGAVTSALVQLGDVLGLYRALADRGPCTSAELAGALGLDERWVREWLHNQGAARLVEVLPEGRFGLSPEATAVLAREEHPAFGAGMFAQLSATFSVLDQLPEAFRSGVGLPYDAFGPEGARGVERGFAPWLRHFLVPVVMGAVPGLRERLEAGLRVADVGCGSGFALLQLARAFPRCELHGYELSRHALARARAAADAQGAKNVVFHDVREEPLPDDGRFDLALTFDCLHDMTRPDEVARGIRAALAADGCWVIADVKAHGSYAEILERNPMAALLYGFSVLTCMSSALSEPGGAGLGTLGLPEAKLGELVRAAGFRSFERLAVDHPVNAFFLARP